MDQIISIALGFVASYVQKGTGKDLTKRTKYIISFSACILAGLLAHVMQIMVAGEFDLNELLANIGIAFATSQTYYNAYFKPKHG